MPTALEEAHASLRVVPISLRQACEYNTRHHRHHRPPPGAKFAVGVVEQGRRVGVATAGRPVSRRLDDGTSLEVTRVATDGARNACSMLYGAVIRAARAMGYRRVVTYTLQTEPGSSLRAAGFRLDHASAGGGSWSRSERPRTDTHPIESKQRWAWP